jgi:hypothetical protein
MVSEARTDVAPVETPTVPPVPEPTGPGTAAAAQEQLRATEKPPSSILTEGDKPAEAPAAEAPAAFDPEKITFPEGFTKDEALFGKFSEIAKAGGLTLPVAQQFADLYADAAKTFADANRTAWNTTVTSWEAEVRADKDVIGKASLKGENGTVLQGLDAVKAMAGKLFSNPVLFDPGLPQALEITGLGSHPAMVRTIALLGPLLIEGGGVRAGGPGPNAGARDNAAPPTAARALYPNLP